MVATRMKLGTITSQSGPIPSAPEARNSRHGSQIPQSSHNDFCSSNPMKASSSLSVFDNADPPAAVRTGFRAVDRWEQEPAANPTSSFRDNL
jgi:hypothetical protein